jgi:Fe-S cluster assembly protein SufD
MSASETATPSPSGGFNETSFEAFLRGRDEPQWLRDRRREAFATFQKAPWPTSRDEEWRRTDIRGFKLDAFAPHERREPPAEAHEAFEPLVKELPMEYAVEMNKLIQLQMEGSVG